MSELTVLIGLPRAGKSTWAKKWVKEGSNRVVLSGDSFRLAITGERFNIDSEPFVRASLITAVKALLIQGLDVAVDETNTSQYHQDQLLYLAPNPNIVIFWTPKAVCQERAIDCNQYDLIPSIERMENNLQDFRESVLKGEINKKINKNSVEEIGPLMYHIFSEE